MAAVGPGGGPVRRPSAARRIGGLDHGTQGRPQYLLRTPGRGRLRSLCPATVAGSWWRGVCGLCGQSAGQADAGDAAWSAAAARFLAPAPTGSGAPLAGRETAAVRPGGGGVCGHRLGAGPRRCAQVPGSLLRADASGQRRRCRRRLPAPDGVADRTGRLLPAPALRVRVAGRARGRRGRAPPGLDGFCFQSGTVAALSADRLAVVSRDAGSGARPGAGRPAGAGRPLHLCAAHRHLPRSGMVAVGSCCRYGGARSAWRSPPCWCCRPAWP